MNFETCYQAYKEMVFNLALQYLQNYEDAEEITQDVFVSVYQNLATFKHASKPSTWIYRIAINKSLDFIKSKKRKKRWGLLMSLSPNGDESFLDEHKDFNHPGVLLEQKEATKRIFRAINELPNQQKTVIILSKIENKSQQEVAEIMQITVKAVESLIQRAKKKLLDKLAKNDE